MNLMVECEGWKTSQPDDFNDPERAELRELFLSKFPPSWRNLRESAGEREKEREAGEKEKTKLAPYLSRFTGAEK
jgi:hypothetical protein